MIIQRAEAGGQWSRTCSLNRPFSPFSPCLFPFRRSPPRSLINARTSSFLLFRSISGPTVVPSCPPGQGTSRLVEGHLPFSPVYGTLVVSLSFSLGCIQHLPSIFFSSSETKSASLLSTSSIIARRLRRFHVTDRRRRDDVRKRAARASEADYRAKRRTICRLGGLRNTLVLRISSRSAYR